MRGALTLALALLALVRVASAVVPAFMDLTLVCDPRPPVEQVRAYRFYERQGTNWVLLGAPATNRITLTNVIVTVPHTYGVSASNVLGESDISAPYVAPSDPRPPTSLGIIQTSLRVPVNSTIAGSTDLLAWQEKQTFKLSVDTNGGTLLVTFKVQPRDPLYFWKEWTGPPAAPLPGGAL
jgi:hypothetical protein